MGRGQRGAGGAGRAVACPVLCLCAPSVGGEAFCSGPGCGCLASGQFSVLLFSVHLLSQVGFCAQPLHV